MVPGASASETSSADRSNRKAINSRSFARRCSTQSAVIKPQEAEALRKLSRGNHGSDTLQRLRQWARDSIGLPVDAILEDVLRQTLDGWLDQLQLLQ